PYDIYFCNGGQWLCTYAGACEPSACNACLDAHCGALFTSADPVCNAGLQKARAWVAACGPDRGAYFTSAIAACPPDTFNQLVSCKNSNCSANYAPCSVW